MIYINICINSRVPTYITGDDYIKKSKDEEDSSKKKRRRNYKIKLLTLHCIGHMLQLQVTKRSTFFQTKKRSTLNLI